MTQPQGGEDKQCGCGHKRSLHGKEVGMKTWCCIACDCLGWVPALPGMYLSNRTNQPASRVRQVGA